jgi:TatD DNase family protein
MEANFQARSHASRSRSARPRVAPSFRPCDDGGLGRYVDSHCHVDRFEDPEGVLATASSAGVITIAVTDVPSHYRLLAAQLSAAKDVRVALGFHPLASAPDRAMELGLFSSQLDQTDYVGEIGLDFSDRGWETRRNQIEILEQILDDDRIRQKVLTVHSRKAEKETIELLAKSRVTAILHSYSGLLGPVEDALAAGFFFSVHPAMVNSQEGRRLLAILPRERVLTETDGPWTPTSGRPAEPRDVPALVGELANIWGVDPDDAQKLVLESMRALHQAATADPQPAGLARQS